MTSLEVIARVDEIMTGGFEIEPTLLRPEAHLINDLGLDSLDAVDLVVAIEKKFGCRLDEAQVRSMKTLGDIYDFCQARERAIQEAGK